VQFSLSPSIPLRYAQNSLAKGSPWRRSCMADCRGLPRRPQITVAKPLPSDSFLVLHSTFYVSRCTFSRFPDSPWPFFLFLS